MLYWLINSSKPYAKSFDLNQLSTTNPAYGPLHLIQKDYSDSLEAFAAEYITPERRMQEPLLLLRALHTQLRRLPPAVLHSERRLRPFLDCIPDVVPNGLAIDVQYLPRQVGSLMRTAIDETQAALGDLWTLHSDQVRGPMDAVLTEALDSVARSLTDTVGRYCSLSRTAAFTASTAAAWLLDMQLIDLARFHAGARARPLIRPALLCLFPLFLNGLVRGIDTVGLWPALPLPASHNNKGLYVANLIKEEEEKTDADGGIPNSDEFTAVAQPDDITAAAASSSSSSSSSSSTGGSNLRV